MSFLINKVHIDKATINNGGNGHNHNSLLPGAVPIIPAANRGEYDNTLYSEP
jgi:hypothetical protein